MHGIDLPSKMGQKSSESAKVVLKEIQIKNIPSPSDSPSFLIDTYDKRGYGQRGRAVKCGERGPMDGCGQ